MGLLGRKRVVLGFGVQGKGYFGLVGQGKVVLSLLGRKRVALGLFGRKMSVFGLMRKGVIRYLLWKEGSSRQEFAGEGGSCLILAGGGKIHHKLAVRNPWLAGERCSGLVGTQTINVLKPHDHVLLGAFSPTRPQGGRCFESESPSRWCRSRCLS